MENLVKYLDCGYYAARPCSFGDFLVLKFCEAENNSALFLKIIYYMGLKA